MFRPRFFKKRDQSPSRSKDWTGKGLRMAWLHTRI